MIAGIVFALWGFEEVADDVFLDPLEGDHEARVFDAAIARFAAGFRGERLTQAMTDLTALGSVSVIATLFVIFAAVLVSFRDRRGIVFISVVLAGAGAWPLILKPLFARARPVPADWLVPVGEFSFPSGHAFGAAAAYVGFAYYATTYARTRAQEIFFHVLGAALAALVGISRIYLGVHFPTDVLAGLCGGLAWGLLVSCLFEWRSSYSGNSRARPGNMNRS